MAFYLCCRITVDNDKVIRSAHSVEIVSTWKSLSDRCTIELPTRGVLKSEAARERTAIRLDNYFKTGMKIVVELGYNEKFVTEFTGYIAEIKTGIKITLECEDESYKLKREGNISKSYKKTTLKALLKDLLPEIKTIDLPEISIENFLIQRATKAFVLQELTDKYGLAIYFRKGVLYAGLPFADRIVNGTKYEIFRNVIEEDLKYLKTEDVRLKVRAVSRLPNNKKIEVEVGDADGEERTLHYYNVDSEASLRKIAEADLKRYKYEGYRGTITTFGIPYVQHGETVEIFDPRYTERRGLYLVDKVTTNYSTSGFRRELEISIKLSV